MALPPRHFPNVTLCLRENPRASLCFLASYHTPAAVPGYPRGLHNIRQRKAKPIAARDRFATGRSGSVHRTVASAAGPGSIPRPANRGPAAEATFSFTTILPNEINNIRIQPKTRVLNSNQKGARHRGVFRRFSPWPGKRCITVVLDFRRLLRPCGAAHGDSIDGRTFRSI